jgi:hypothetical protein
MFKISEFAPYFSKNSFDIKPETKIYSKKKEINKKKEDIDLLFYTVYTNVKLVQNVNDILKQYNERDEKIKIAEQLEQMKFKNKDDIMNNIIYDKRIKLITLNMICKLLNINLIYIYDKLFIRMKYNNTNPIVINNFCKIIEDFDLENLNNMFEINLEKSLKSVSSYKLGELQEIAKKMDITIDKKKKQDLYNEIKEYLNNHRFN